MKRLTNFCCSFLFLGYVCSAICVAIVVSTDSDGLLSVVAMVCPVSVSVI